ncbi:hypothetical protein HF521_021817 [Silurus meridionalis]|uniref:Shootin-1 n=1 Tax=Silurus meridionalis TaxID=175797 RepID=A0A8T0BCK0_SILME|nr:hypothetical protein HF521_021817 [Silurus meridionalis]
MATTEEETQMRTISVLSDQAIRHYEGLRNEHEKTRQECKQLKQERDEALQKLHDFERVSHMVLQEVSSMQENLEVEKTCRQTVEALATKLNRQNRSLKRKSMMYMAHLDANVIAEINLSDEEENHQEEEAEICSSSHCQIVISELRNKLEACLEEKKKLAFELETTKDLLHKTREELLREKHDNTVLIAETLQQKKLLGKYNRVSQYAVEEYEALQADLELEKDLRVEAENFAHKMLVEQKKLKRQSQVMMQSVSPSEALANALKEITSLTHTMEKQRLEHQKQLKRLEEELHGSELQKQLAALERKTAVLEEERKECMEKCSKAETEAKDLRFTVEELQKSCSKCQILYLVHLHLLLLHHLLHLLHLHLQSQPTLSARSCHYFVRKKAPMLTFL